MFIRLPFAAMATTVDFLARLIVVVAMPRWGLMLSLCRTIIRCRMRLGRCVGYIFRRRLLRKIATDDYDALGDTSTLADPGVVDQLIAAHEAVKQR